MSETAVTKEKECPQCHAMMPVASKYVTWCDQCGWNGQSVYFVVLFDQQQNLGR